MLYSHNVADKLIGCYLQKPELCLDPKYPIDKDEFVVLFHKIIYATIYNLSIQGCKSISIMDIDSFVSPYETEYNVLKDNSFEEYIETITELTDYNNFEYYYNEFRKISYIRDCKEKYGITLNDIYDETKDEEKELSKLKDFSMKDLIDIVRGKLAELENDYLIEENVEDYKAGEDFSFTKESLKESPLVGDSFQSPYTNAIFNGMYGFIFRSGKSGGGKTVASCGDICKVSATHYWDDKVGDFVENKSFVGAGLILSTEMDMRKELDLILIAWISNVDRRHIRRNQYDSKEQEMRVDKAGEILKNSPIYCVDCPDFTIDLLTRKITYYVLNKGVKNVCFDYVQSQPFVNKEISKELNIPPREDLVLLTITDRLKTLQRKLGINLISGSQLNGQEDSMSYPTECCLAGGKSQIRKLDGAMIMLPPTKKELDAISLVDNRIGFGLDKCNRITHIIKGRANEYEEHLKLCQHLDLGTGRVYDICVLDKNNKPYKVEKLIIESE